jgi:hypothetical protein
MLFKDLIAATFDVFTTMLKKIQVKWDYTSPEDGGTALTI